MPNPRQIKRIINGIALFQEIGRMLHGIKPGSTRWCNLALWVVIMTEWPKTWATLSHYPALVDRIRFPQRFEKTKKKDDAEHHDSGPLPNPEVAQAWIKAIKSNPELWA